MSETPPEDNIPYLEPPPPLPKQVSGWAAIVGSVAAGLLAVLVLGAFLLMCLPTILINAIGVPSPEEYSLSGLQRICASENADLDESVCAAWATDVQASHPNLYIQCGPRGGPEEPVQTVTDHEHYQCILDAGVDAP
jgi:hypothetical protein